MSTDIAHFAINADDPEASLRFYEALFGWRFEPWGPPGFFRMERESGPVIALQQRRDLGGVRMTGFECTVAVDDVGAVAEAVVANGGRLLMERTAIPGVGELIFFEDPAGNVAGAIQFARRLGASNVGPATSRRGRPTFDALGLQRGEDLLRRPLARAHRAVHVAVPEGRGLGAGPVDAIDGLADRAAVVEQHAGRGEARPGSRASRSPPASRRRGTTSGWRPGGRSSR